MSRSEYERAWGTAGWLDDHELKGEGRTVCCQRKTLAYRYVEDMVSGLGMNIGGVYRKRRDKSDPGMHAVFLWGTEPVETVLLRKFETMVLRFYMWPNRHVARITTFLYDMPSGGWKAIVVFRKEAK